MLNDYQAIHAQAKEKFEKVKNALNGAKLSLKELSTNLGGLSTDGVIIKSIDSEQKEVETSKVLELQQQFHFEEKKFKYAELKLLSV